MEAQLKAAMDDSLVWFPEQGWGWFNVREAPYDDGYFAKYEGYAATPMGEAICRFRCNLVNQHTLGSVVDVGIGCGQFVDARRRMGHPTYGFDVNPAGQKWLNDWHLYVDPYAQPVDAVTFWDVLEHIHDPAPLMANVKRFAFVSIPIFRNAEHVLSSKHFRRDEHCLYFTADGLKRWMRGYGFRCIDTNTGETDLGREDIETFVFERMA